MNASLCSMNVSKNSTKSNGNGQTTTEWQVFNSNSKNWMAGFGIVFVIVFGTSGRTFLTTKGSKPDKKQHVASKKN